MHIYVHKICEDKCDSCKKSLSWLGKKVNKNRSMRMATMLTIPVQTCAHGNGMTPCLGKTCRHILVFYLKPLNIRIRFNSY